jgi:hypothetical protein
MSLNLKTLTMCNNSAIVASLALKREAPQKIPTQFAPIETLKRGQLERVLLL